MSINTTNYHYKYVKATTFFLSTYKMYSNMKYSLVGYHIYYLNFCSRKTSLEKKTF